MHENPLLFRNLKALQIVGMWPPKSNRLKPIYHVYSRLVFVWFVCFTTSQFVEIYFVHSDFKELTSNAGVSLLYAVAIAKVYLVLFKRPRIKKLVEIIRESELAIMQSDQTTTKKILRDYILQNWGVTKKFWLLTFWTILGFFISPTLEAFLIGPQEIFLKNGTGSGRFRRPLVFSSYFPFDKYTNGHYQLAYGLQTISGTIGASYLGIWDTFIVALMIYAIGQFRILQHSLKTLDPTLADDSFVSCIKHHCKIIKYVKDLDKLISPVMFLDFGVCSLMLCAIGLQAILEGPSVRLAFTIEYLIAMLIQLFMFYWHANEIMLEVRHVTKTLLT